MKAYADMEVASHVIWNKGVKNACRMESASLFLCGTQTDLNPTVKCGWAQRCRILLLNLISSLVIMCFSFVIASINVSNCVFIFKQNV
jgi:hypothetical protein